MSKKKIALYGGTFNPPHIGHYEAALAFMNYIKPDELLIIPARIPPHKDFSLDFPPEVRLEMCKIAFSPIPGVTVSDLEIKREGKSYTYLTLEELSGEDRELYFLLGTDMFLTLDTWRYPEKIFSLAKICLIRRESNDDIDKEIENKKALYSEKYGAEIIEIKKNVIEISSSELRDKIKDSQDVSEYLSSELTEYIKNGGYYL